MSVAATIAGSGPALLSAAGLMQGDETLFWLVVALLATVVMFGTFCSYLLARHLLNRRRPAAPDPVFIFHPFKFNGSFSFPGEYPCRGMAIKTRQPTAVLQALQITKATPCTWEEGLARSFERKLFVSPPVNGWIVVLGAALPDPAADVDVCFRFLTNLSRKLGHVQFFNMNRNLCHHAWAVLEKGEVLRAYAWGGATLWNQGQITPAEIDLELKCLDYGHHAAEAGDDQSATTEKVPLLAARWGLDPAVLARCLTDERGGLTGELRSFKQV